MKIKFVDLELGPMIGVGTVGAVHRATLKQSGEQVAVKLLHPAISQDKLIRARFRREMQILEKLEHPNIIRYLGDGENDGQLFYVMELLESGTVKELLERFGSLSWKEVASIARQVSSALQHAHNQGIIHRDLKPSNLFVTESGQIKLGDFGIARDTRGADITNQGLTVGTHAYMPPEQITGDAHITGKADLYSLGCVMFELLTGKKPFQANNFAALFEQHLRSPAPRVTDFVTNCPQGLAEMVAKLLEKDPNKRPFNARSVQAEMLKLFDEPAPTKESKRDVAAGSVLDPGMSSLAGKLSLTERPPVSWITITIVAICAVLMVIFAAIAAQR